MDKLLKIGVPTFDPRFPTFTLSPRIFGWVGMKVFSPGSPGPHTVSL